MESSGGTSHSGVDFLLRKKRSGVLRRPISHPEKLVQTLSLLPLSTQSLASGIDEGDSYPRGNTVSYDAVKSEGRPKKLKLKLGGVTHTIHAKAMSDEVGGSRSTVQRSSYLVNAAYSSDKQLQASNDSTSDKSSSFRSNVSGRSVYINETYNYEPVRKSKRVPKRRVIDVGYIEDGEEEEDDEIRYLGRPSTSRVHAKDNLSKRNDKSEKKLKVLDGGLMGERIYSKVEKYGKNTSKSGNIDNDEDYMEEDEFAFDHEPEYARKKLGSSEERDDGYQHSNDISLRSAGSSFVEFPNGLPPAPKKQKPKVSETEQQLKRAEALQRRRMQSEKAAREAEAEAIRKILGQDSGRKKKEEKLKKQQEELAQVKAAKQDTLGPNTIRWITGPNGKLVIFSEDVGLPNIFNSRPGSYPSPREKCAGPNCTNAYKYRDSKLKIPLCSLNCYKAVHGKSNPLVSC